MINTISTVFLDLYSVIPYEQRRGYVISNISYHKFVNLSLIDLVSKSSCYINTWCNTFVRRITLYANEKFFHSVLYITGKQINKYVFMCVYTCLYSLIDIMFIRNDCWLYILLNINFVMVSEIFH